MFVVQGQKVALIGRVLSIDVFTVFSIRELTGTSGCGKSTTIQLIERFYDPNGGGLVNMDFISFAIS